MIPYGNMSIADLKAVMDYCDETIGKLMSLRVKSVTIEQRIKELLIIKSEAESSFNLRIEK